jgi:UDP-N-acetylmuramate dehydrogenase
MRKLENEPLAPRTTLGIGGPASQLYEIEKVSELSNLLSALRAARKPPTLLGGGSNVVIADEGVESPIICLRTCRIEDRKEGDGFAVYADAGVTWDDLVSWAVARDLCGIECLAGIPGCVGATPIQNVGAYGQQVSDCLRSVHVFDRSTHETATLAAADCQLGYRDSIFKNVAKGRYIVLGATFLLAKGRPAAPRYAELQRALEAQSDRSVGAIQKTVLALRRKKSMVVDENDPDSRSAGSFFVNPVVSESELATIETRAHQSGALSQNERIRHFSDGKHFKIPAAWLIEQSGFEKGTRRGGVAISSKHSLALVNRENGTARELCALAAEIRAGVAAAFGVALRPEPVFVGFDHPPLG